MTARKNPSRKNIQNEKNETKTYIDKTDSADNTEDVELIVDDISLGAEQKEAVDVPQPDIVIAVVDGLLYDTRASIEVLDTELGGRLLAKVCGCSEDCKPRHMKLYRTPKGKFFALVDVTIYPITSELADEIKGA